MPTTTTTMPGFDWTFTPESRRPTVTLIDAGNEPREVRTYNLAVGMSVETSMRLATTIDQEIDGITATSASTTVDQAFRFDVTDVLPEGFVVVSTFGDFRVKASDRSTESALESVYDNLVGVSTTQLVAPTGEIVAVARNDEFEEFSEIANALAGAAPALPSDPIGVGALWTVVGTVEFQGVSVVQTSTFTLIAAEGPLLTVAIEVEQELGPGGLNIPGLDELDADVALSSSGVGQAVWDLSSPVQAVSSTLETVQMLTLTAMFDGVESTLKQTTTVSVEVPSPGPLAPPEGTLFFDIADSTHTEGSVEYEEDPPAGGPHAAVWQNCGFYVDPIANETGVHSLEHGAVWITYQPGLANDQVEHLMALGEMPFTLVSPYPDLDTAVVASGWGVQLRLDSALDPRLAQFVEWFAAGPQTPEPGAPCTFGVGEPE